MGALCAGAKVPTSSPCDVVLIIIGEPCWLTVPATIKLPLISNDRTSVVFEVPPQASIERAARSVEHRECGKLVSGTDGRNGYGTVCLEFHAFIGFSSDPNT